jgi:ACR3 family arsenite efflux pump ArsB
MNETEKALLAKYPRYLALLLIAINRNRTTIEAALIAFGLLVGIPVVIGIIAKDAVVGIFVFCVIYCLLHGWVALDDYLVKISKDLDE